MSSSYLFLNGLRLHYLYWNLDGDGRPVVLLHGLASNARIWERMAPYLSEQGLTSFSPDLRGHGLSDKPDGDYGFGTFRQDLQAILDGLNCERPVLVGHSWGALLALDYAARFPVGPRAPAGIVLVDGGISQLDQIPGATWEKIRARLAPPDLAGMPQEEFLATYARRNGSWDPQGEAAQIMLANFEVGQDETIRSHLTFERHMQILRSIWEFQTFESMARVRCPACAVLALPFRSSDPQEQDYLAAKQAGAERALQVKPDLELHWMEDTIHDIPLQRPAELGELIAGFARRL
jgi:pimeloyl-ACP methyl ester carboxylesterase